MSVFRSLTLLLLILTLPARMIAGGSVTWDDANRILGQNSQLQKFVNSTLDIPEQGSATRLGKHFENLGGARVGPYVFDVKPKGADGGAQLQLTIETEMTFVDAVGEPLNEDDDFRLAEDVRERFLGVRLDPIGAVSSTAAATIGTVELSEEDAKTRSRWIGDHWREISEREHRVVKIEIELEDEPVSGLVERRHHSETGMIESIRVDLALGDHGGFTDEFFFWDEEPFFVLRQESHWRFDPEKEGRTIDFVEEERFYYTEGGVYRALSKKYQANSEESLDEARDDAKNTPLEYAETRPAELHTRAMKLLDAVTQEDVLAIYLAE
ncbi:MAG: hypothetical protein AAF585_12980 [Verrucomicrobiota bacterium]